MSRSFFSTSELRRHSFESGTFWYPFCTTCHEKEDHPVHRKPGISEVCGHDPCSYCAFIGDPERGVTLR